MVWKILSGLFHVGNVGGALASEYVTKKKSERLHEERTQLYYSWLDPELEARTRAYVSNPKNHDKVWDELREYRRTHRALLEAKKRADITAGFKKEGWQTIWEMLFEKEGYRITPNSALENLATACYMDMEDKKPKYLADHYRTKPLW